MAIDESEPEAYDKRIRYFCFYAALFMTTTSITVVIFSLAGYISLDPPTAFVASLFAGFSFLLVQITYARFVANSAQSSIMEPQPDIT